MNISAILGSPLLGLVKWAVPQASGVIDFLQRHQQVIASAEPVIKAAIAEGKPAFEAAVKQAPQFAQAVKVFLEQHAQTASPTRPAPTPLVLENITRNFVGHPVMTPEEEKRWMDNATPHNDPSQENSRFGG